MKLSEEFQMSARYSSEGSFCQKALSEKVLWAFCLPACRKAFKYDFTSVLLVKMDGRAHRTESTVVYSSLLWRLQGAL